MITFYSQPEHRPFVIGNGRLGALLIHGFPGTPAEMRPLAERLAAGGFTAHGPLLPGFGADISRLGETGRRAWLDAVHQEWASISRSFAQTALIGFSMGAALAIHAAAVRPPDALVLLAPFWQLSGWEAKLLPLMKHIFRQIRPFAQADFSNPAVRRQLQEIAPELNLDDLKTQAALRREIVLPTAVVDEVRRLGMDGYRRATAVQTPTLVLQGRHDDTVTPAQTRRLLTQLGGPVLYREFPGDHAFVKMQPPNGFDFTADVTTFLSRTIDNH